MPTPNRLVSVVVNSRLKKKGISSDFLSGLNYVAPSFFGISERRFDRQTRPDQYFTPRGLDNSRCLADIGERARNTRQWRRFPTELDAFYEVINIGFDGINVGSLTSDKGNLTVAFNLPTWLAPTQTNNPVNIAKSTSVILTSHTKRLNHSGHPSCCFSSYVGSVPLGLFISNWSDATTLGVGGGVAGVGFGSAADFCGSSARS